MKLDVNALRYLSREDFRVLTAVEMGQKNVSRTTSFRSLLPSTTATFACWACGSLA